MVETRVFAAGGYRYIPAVFQYSGGVAAEPGWALERARFARPLPLAAGFAAVEVHLATLGRPPTAFAACELRTPAPYSDQGFTDFNRHYVQTLARWGIFRDEDNPVARTNVCPEVAPPAEPLLYAFSYTVPSTAARGGFIVAGSGEAREGSGPYRERAVRHGETTPDALRDKVRHVLGEMERRLRLLGFDWSDAVSTQAYTVHDIGALIGEEFAARGAIPGGLSWHWCRPPIVGLEYEMDVRGAVREYVI